MNTKMIEKNEGKAKEEMPLRNDYWEEVVSLLDAQERSVEAPE